MFPYELYVIGAIASILTIIWISFLVMGSKEFNSIVNPLASKEYPLKELYVIGFFMLKILKCDFISSGDKKRLKDVSNVYGERYANYYLRVVYAQKLTFSFTILLIFCYFSLLDMNGILALFGIFVAVIIFYYLDLRIKDKIEAKEEDLLREFPEVLSKLTLLINAGMIMRDAWGKVSLTGEGRLYTEMQLTIDEMNNGISEVNAFMNFGTRCSVNEIKKFTSSLVQNLTKGNSELV